MVKTLFWLFFFVTTTICFACDKKENTREGWIHYIMMLQGTLDDASSDITNTYTFQDSRYHLSKAIFEKLTHVSKKLSKDKNQVIQENKITDTFKIYTFIKHDGPYRVFCIDNQKMFIFRQKVTWSNLSDKEKKVIKEFKASSNTGWGFAHNLIFFKVDNNEKQIVMFQDLINGCDISNPQDSINADASL